jgi:GAF domain-containing protein
MSLLHFQANPAFIGSSALVTDTVSNDPFELQVHELGCPRPPCEDGRAMTMEVLGICNPLPDPDPELEAILKISNSIFGTPTSTITLLKGGCFGEDSHDVVYVKDADGCARGDYPWRWAFCTWITQTGPTPQTLVVPDAEKDARFSENIHVVGENPWIKAYAGAPLVASNGHRLGTLCVCDDKARDFDAGQCTILNNLSEMVVRHLEKEKLLKMKQSDNEALRTAYKRIERALDCFENCVVMLDTSVPGFRVVYVNEAWDSLTGISRDKITGHNLSEIF